MENKRFQANKENNKKRIIIYVAVALVLVLVLGLIGSLFIPKKQTGSTGSPGYTQSELVDKINALQAKVNELASAQNVSVSALSDAVVVNGEVRLPSRGLEYELNEDMSSYTLTGLGACKDSDVVVPRRYNGQPVVAVGDNAFEGAQIDSINLYEDVIQIGSYAFKDSTVRFIYLYSDIPVTLLVDPIPDTVKGIFVPLELVDTCKGYWSAYSSKVTAIETPASINNTIVTAVANLQMIDAYLVQELYKLNPDRYSQGLEYNVISVDGVLGFEVAGIGTCTDTDIIIPAMYGEYPVLRIGDNAFKDNVNITSVVISKTVKSIGNYAFHGCTNLKTVSFMSDVPPEMIRAGCSFDFAVQVYRVPSSSEQLYVGKLNNVLGTAHGLKVKPVDTIESLRAEIDSIKESLEVLANG